MSQITIAGLRREFRGKPPVLAVDGIDLEVAEGELLVLLGPSGCGKTTTLRCLAGLEQPDAGVIRFGDHTVYDRERGIDVASHRRDIGLVFQSFALWPHLSARMNIEFPLRSRRVPKAERGPAVAEVARLLDLTDALLDKRPSQLSGGQQQRVALGRALVAQPKVVLFDEPLSNLDALLREQLRIELSALHRRIGFTGVYVTHDLREAATLGDRVAVMHRGVLGQVGTANEVFDTPRSADIARLVGYRRLGAAEVDAAGGLHLAGAPTGLRVPPDGAAGLDAYARPARVAVTAPGHHRHLAVAAAEIEQLTVLSDAVEAHLRLDGRSIQLQLAEDQPVPFRAGDHVVLDVAARDLRWFDTESGRAVALAPTGMTPMADAV